MSAVSYQSPLMFDVVQHVSLVLQEVADPLPDEQESQGPPNEEGGPNTCMIIPDCGGRAEFTFQVCNMGHSNH